MLISNNRIINAIVNSVYWADRLSRSDLIKHYIVKEDDYTSNLTSNIRQQINSKSIPGLVAHSQVLPPAVERKYGCDACIIIAGETHYKIGLFEAKWPRLSISSGKYDWDSTVRFSDQLTKQSKLPTSFAIWEMFYCEYPYLMQPANFPNHISSCAKHKHAIKLDASKKHKKWDNTDLDMLLNSHMTTISHIVREMCLCSFGAPHTGDWRAVVEEYGFREAMDILVVEYNSNNKEYNN